MIKANPVKQVMEPTDQDLSDGWAKATLEELIIHALGGDWGKAPEEKPIDWVYVKVIRGTEFRNWSSEKGESASIRSIKPSSLNNRQLYPGDIVIEISGGGPDQPVGRSLLIDNESCSKTELPLVCSNFCRQVRTHPEVDSAYIQHVLQYQYSRGAFDRFQNQTVNIRNLQFPEFVGATYLPLAPHAEQKRIVAMVEELLARVTAARDRLEKVPKIMKRFRQAVLVAACSGKLTEDWRKGGHETTSVDESIAAIVKQRQKQWESKDNRGKYEPPKNISTNSLPDLPDSWQYVSSDTLFSFITSGSRGWAKYYSETGATFLRVGNLDHDSISLDLSQVQRVKPPKVAEGRRTQVRVGDILISITADVGMIALIHEDIGEAYVNQHIALARPVEGFYKPFVAWYLSFSQGGQLQFEELQRGATKAGLGLDNIKSIAVPFPPVEEQQEIVRRVEAFFRLADAIEKRVESAKIRSNKLTQSILAKAFRGELVPTEAELACQEGRDYETASALLERIRKERTEKSPQ